MKNKKGSDNADPATLSAFEDVLLIPFEKNGELPLATSQSPANPAVHADRVTLKENGSTYRWLHVNGAEWCAQFSFGSQKNASMSDG